MNVLARVAWKNMSVVAPAVAAAAVLVNGSGPVTAALKAPFIGFSIFRQISRHRFGEGNVRKWMAEVGRRETGRVEEATNLD